MRLGSIRILSDTQKGVATLGEVKADHIDAAAPVERLGVGAKRQCRGGAVLDTGK